MECVNSWLVLDLDCVLTSSARPTSGALSNGVADLISTVEASLVSECLSDDACSPLFTIVGALLDSDCAW